MGILLFRLARTFALAGGFVVVALTLMSLANIVGRGVFAKPLPGDYELVQLGCAVAVSAFLPFCQMRGGHVLVDFFTANSRRAVRGGLDTLGALLLAIAAAVIAWRLAADAMSLRAANDQTTILADCEQYQHRAEHQKPEFDAGQVSSSLFNAANAVIGDWRGGVAMAAVGACAGFGAVCGSSLATAATLRGVAVLSKRRPILAAGLLVAQSLPIGRANRARLALDQ